MRKLKITLSVLVFLLVGGLLHYVLPQHDVVKITSTEVIRMDFSGINRIFFAQADSASAELSTRDIRLINTTKRQTWLLGFFARDKEKVMVYRNEDTGWIWPPYFKFDSSDLQAEAAAVISTTEPYDWVQITHYGWRIRWLTIYPNAISIKPVEGPDHRPLPWFNILFLIGLGVAAAMLRAMWLQFRERTLDPLADQAGDRFDEVGAGIAERRGRLRRWLDTWKSKR
jgi:hypothetical protein